MKTIFLFPGYGSQFVGMGKGLYDDFRIMQEYFEEASHCAGQNFVKLCFATSEVELSRMSIAYPSIFLVSCAIAQILKEQGIHPDAVAGYNNGEYAAIHTARGLTFPDGLYLLSKFDSFYQELCIDRHFSGIRVEGIAYQQVSQWCQQVSREGESVYIAAHEQHDVMVVFGHVRGMDRLQAIVRNQGSMRYEGMPVEFGLHSVLMEAISTQYTLYMEKVDFKDLEVPLHANTGGTSVTLAHDVKERVIEQVTHELRWYDVLKSLDEYDCIVVIGPGTELQKMVQEMYPEKKCVAVNTKSDIKMLKQMMHPSTDGQEE